jgi:hypothetical protein
MQVPSPAKYVAKDDVVKCTYCGKFKAKYAVSVAFEEKDYPQGMRCTACTIESFRVDLKEIKTFTAYVIKPL